MAVLFTKFLANVVDKGVYMLQGRKDNCFTVKTRFSLKFFMAAYIFSLGLVSDDCDGQTIVVMSFFVSIQYNYSFCTVGHCPGSCNIQLLITGPNP